MNLSRDLTEKFKEKERNRDDGGIDCTPNPSSSWGRADWQWTSMSWFSVPISGRCNQPKQTTTFRERSNRLTTDSPDITATYTRELPCY
jgi:hypothetical protein